MRHQAIRTLYPSVVTIDHLGAYDKDGNVVSITENDVSAKQVELVTQADAEQVAAAEAKSSAIGKLKALGLNDAEIASITGG
jgi:hypothetical protein